ncbi:hypothetical protein HU200_055938 [Digitaria exilis]|uniref:F-box domain-containing protein n=1 Tax=Digitaria exilis TaxID=1010633 RepID=A0A835AH58_9POAL|nr:hypothetical protein HU200_055938 [Digitaria exilis]
MQDTWHHILSLLPLRDAARASRVSRAFLRSWRCHPNLTLENFSHTIDCILRRHSGVGVKILILSLYGIANNDNLDSWLQVAVAPGIEEIMLLAGRSKMEYNFPCSLLSEGIRNSIQRFQLRDCAFHPTPELGPLSNLKRLCLESVGITGYELECFISHSRSLEWLELTDCQGIISLKIPCELQQLNCLRVRECWRLRVLESKAPNLSDLATTGKVKLFGETLQMKHLSMFFQNAVHYARAELPSIMPNLERLSLASGAEVHSKTCLIEHLTVLFTSGLTFSPSYDYFSLVFFLDASPSLETLILDVTQLRMGQISVFEDSSSLRQIAERHYCCLKSVKITGFSSAKSLVELVCHVLKNAVSLESLTLDTLHGWRCSEENHPRCFIVQKDMLMEATRAVEAIGTYIKDKVPATVKLSAVEPCSRCHKVGGRAGKNRAHSRRR